MIRGAIFDIDGTILDSSRVWDEAPSRFLREYGMTPPADLISCLLPLTLQEGAAYLKERFSLPPEAAEIEEDILGIVRRIYLQEVPAKVWVRPCLQLLQDAGLPIVLATGGNLTASHMALTRLGLDRYPMACLSCDRMHTSKREPAIFLEAAHLIGAEPAQILVFEDNLTALQTAAAAGFRTVGVFDFSNRDHREALISSASMTVDGDRPSPDFTEKVRNLLCIPH